MKNAFKLLLLSLTLSWFTSCIGDDFIMDNQDPEVRITTLLDTLEINTSFQFEAVYLNSVGLEEELPVSWSSSDEAVVSISNNGIVNGLSIGKVAIAANVDNGTDVITDMVELNVGTSTVSTSSNRMGIVQTTSSYKLEGEFELVDLGNGTLSLS